ncbi:NADP-dependent malic enzyme [Pauljensenia sp. UMB1235]|uniref:NAD(P)-dependent malic enzyme n=1 Tax=unclassified Pauljensenia TaxID=2908895 RepID=UPI00254A2775|nr:MULTISPECIES: NADP-dependent malic enzyme [unclassified Pauljensenia]MDK6399695.1 NADP-dependent malic enzyme [Pauljensenia sp. UMB9872]MDK7172058.1 NADP-dependent malic enzyme [Pauljensenia sp. UMB1235]
MRTSPSYTASYRVDIDEAKLSIGSLVEAVSKTGAQVRGLDVADSNRGRMVLDLTCDLRDSEHRREVRNLLKGLVGVTLSSTADQTFLAHVGGKIEINSKVPLRNRDDLSRAYTPGVARVCTAIHDVPQKAHLLTIKANTVAVVSDGTAVLGLGDIGPEAALPVMEGKAALFKEFGGVDAWPVVLDTKDTEEIISIVKAIAPAYGGINLEDISAPRCFEIEERLRAELDIPVFHDDQHGTAIVVLSALINALKIVNKKIEDVRIVVSGVGAAGNAIIRLLLAQGAKDIVGYGRTGALAADDTEGMHPSRKALAEATNPRLVHGNLKEGLKDADVFIGVSHGDILDPADIATMADGAIVFALANPTPEVDPIGAGEYAAVVATGRSDYPNQINNVLAFPGLFRGLLDAKVKEITTEVLRVAAVAIADVIEEEELSPSYIIPGVFDERVAPAVSRAVRTAVRDLPTLNIPVQEDMDA